jgi:hypothetical protein
VVITYINITLSTALLTNYPFKLNLLAKLLSIKGLKTAGKSFKNID